MNSAPSMPWRAVRMASDLAAIASGVSAHTRTMKRRLNGMVTEESSESIRLCRRRMSFSTPAALRSERNALSSSISLRRRSISPPTGRGRMQRVIEAPRPTASRTGRSIPGLVPRGSSRMTKIAW
jgi:hypothetical protein